MIPLPWGQSALYFSLILYAFAGTAQALIQYKQTLIDEDFRRRNRRAPKFGCKTKNARIKPGETYR
jgi:hypothetical protein